MFSMKRSVLTTAAALTVAATTVGASPAVAADGYAWAYLKVDKSVCVGGGKVVDVFGAVDNVWSGGDAGDNVVYAKVALGRVNTFNGVVHCKARGRNLYKVDVVGKEFTPTRNKQTFRFYLYS